MEKPARVCVFIDYQNMIGVGRNVYAAYGAPRSQIQLRPMTIAERIIAKRDSPSELVEVRVYRGMPDEKLDPAWALSNKRAHAAWQRDQRVTVVSTPLVYPPDFPDEPAHEDGVDEALAADLIAMGRQFDVAVVASHDLGLRGALWETIKSRLVKVEVAAWRGFGTRLRLSDTSSAPWCHWLTEDDWKAALERSRLR